VLIDGRRATLRPASPADTVADLAAALGLGPDLVIDATRVAATDRLVATPLRAGSAITVTGPAVAATATVGPDDVGVEAAVTAGPACLEWRSLGPGRHRVGRAPEVDLRIDDPDVELHHGLLDVAENGTVTFTQLTGRVPARIDGRPCHDTDAVTLPSSLLLGASRLDLRRRVDTEPVTTGSIVGVPGDPWRRVVRRGPVVPPGVPPGQLRVPEALGDHRAPPMSGLVGAGVAAGGAGLMAAILGQPLFALLGAVGAVASTATWAVSALGARRARRRAEATHRRSVDAFLHELSATAATAARHHRARHPSLTETLGGAACGELWSRRVTGDEPLRATLGSGTVRWHPTLDGDPTRSLPPDVLRELERAACLGDVAVPVEFLARDAVALHGDLGTATALARAVIVQLAVWAGPADWRLVVVTDRPDEWSWANWLPHAVGGSTVVRPIDDGLVDLAVDDGQRLLVVTDEPAALAARTAPLRRLLDASGAAVIVVNRASASVPTVCTRVLTLGPHGLGRWRQRTDLDDGCVHVAGLSRDAAEAAARGLAPLLDPEDPDGATSTVPATVQLAEVVTSFDPEVIAAKWAGDGGDPAPTATIGRAGDGTVAIDLVRDGPHALIAGTTGAGKSELLRTLVAALAANVSPSHLNFVLVDFKGGATFDACARLPHCVGVVTDLDEGLAHRAIVSLEAEIRRRERLLRDVRADDLTGYRRNATEPLARLVVVVDEFATLAKELPDVLAALVGIAQRGRSLGIHLLLATQRPAGVVTDDIRANTNLRLALRVHDRSDAIDVVGDDRPARIPRSVPGRAVLRLGPDELVVFQAASSSGPVRAATGRLSVVWADDDDVGGVGEATELECLVEAIATATAVSGLASPHRPWLDPLPERLDRATLGAALAGECDGSVVGLVDDPAAQARRPLRWTRSSGNLLLVGALGSGTTTTAVTVAIARLRDRTPDEVHLYVIDGRGDRELDALAALAHCGGVVRVTETERLDRLLLRIDREIDRRSLDTGRRPDVVVLVDGVESIRTALATVERADSAMRFDRMVQDGPATGIVTCATTDGSSPAVLAAFTGVRWILHLDDHAIARACGVATTVPRVPGRLRIAGSDRNAGSDLAAQVVVDDDPAAGVPRRQPDVGPPAIDVLPSLVDPDDVLPAAGRDPTGLVVGLAAENLRPAVLEVPPGDHLFVSGPARSGKSTAVRQLTAAWCAAHPDGTVIDVDRRHPLDAATLDAHPGPVLVVVDDADRVDDPGGELAAIVAGRRRDVTVLAAARPEAVRAAYGHWVRDVARSRCGLVLTTTGDPDGELLGVTLPRRSIVAARPGLAWLIDAGGPRLVQVAARMPA
jgi:DNA segregation ATPase FtsK/SpoIIIE, S-DNA-T family